MFSKQPSMQQHKYINRFQAFCLLMRFAAIATAVGLSGTVAVSEVFALPFLPSEPPQESPEEKPPEEVEPVEIEPMEVLPREIEPTEEFDFQTFAQWCNSRNNLPSETQKTIEVLLQKAGTSNCSRADEKLSEATELMLFRRQLSDLRPLSSLTNLSELWLDTNYISDLSPLAALTNLKKLWLENNKIADITPLSGLGGLTHLSLENNLVSDVRSLSRLSNLTRLNLSTNNVSEIESLSALTSLTYLNLRGNPIVPEEEDDEEPCPIEPESVCQY